MKRGLLAISVACMAGTALAGPDMTVSRIGATVSHYGSVGGIGSYAFGTTSCNRGTVILAWIDSGSQAWRHPVISMNMFRLKDGRFEQIGQSWLKHGFCAADSALCDSCQFQSSCDWLGLGCSDVYSSGLNGSQSGLGPKSEVNPRTGDFTWPHSTPGGGTLNGRLLIDQDDMNPSMNSGALYFGESQYIHPDDAKEPIPASTNNNSYRRVNVNNFQGGQWRISFTGSTQEGQPAIQAWQDFDTDVTLVNVDTDGRYIVGYKVTDNGNGTWDYEYAVQNMNSDLAADGWSVGIGAGANITNIGFNDVDYHSGEPYDPTDWGSSVDSDSVDWNSPQSFQDNPNTNALRWGTLYNFRFTADTGPVAGTAVLSNFKNTSLQDRVVDVLVPDSAAVPACPGDLNTTGTTNGVPDGVTNISDLQFYLNEWQNDLGNTPGSIADINTTGQTNGVPDGVVNISDLQYYFNEWQTGLGECP